MERELNDVRKKSWLGLYHKKSSLLGYLCIIAGIIVGYVNPALGIEAKPGIDWFIKVIKVVCWSHYIFNYYIWDCLENLKELGSLGFKAFILL